MSEYCLRWNNHQPNLVKVFSDLLTTEALVDVTLATDGHFIQAHQLVLSACSVYFRDLFMTNNCKHPIVILKDIRIEDLKTIIDFIYRGEVNVCQERLQDVLKVAGSLRIKGLTENQQNVEEVPSHGTLRPLQQASSSSSVRNDLQATSQRSSLTDSREQSLSVEEDINDRDRGSRSPPERKKRKMSSQESSESAPDPIEDSKLGLSDAVKEEPREDRENERSHSRETEPEYNVGGVADAMLMLKSGNGEGGEDSNQGHGGLGSGPGAEGSSGPLSHSQVSHWRKKLMSISEKYPPKRKPTRKNKIRPTKPRKDSKKLSKKELTIDPELLQYSSIKSKKSLKVLQKIQATSFNSLRDKVKDFAIDDEPLFDSNNNSCKEETSGYSSTPETLNTSSSPNDSQLTTCSDKTVDVEPVYSNLSDNEQKRLGTEMQLLVLDKELRESLNVHNPCSERALKCLDVILSLTVDELMLKKNPRVVDAIAKCSRYRYNDLIRLKAEKIFLKFKNAFPKWEQKDIVDWESYFNNKVNEFNIACEITGVDKSMFVYLIQDPTYYLNKKKNPAAFRKSLPSTSKQALNKDNVDEKSVVYSDTDQSQNGKKVLRVQPSRMKKSGK